MSMIVHIAAIVFTGLGLLFCIISTSTNNWFESETTFLGTKVEGHSGLWRGCGNSNCESIIVPDGSEGDKLRATRAFTILAILAYGLAGLSILLTFIKKMFVLIFILGAAGAVFCQMVGMAIYTDMMKDAVKADGASYGWSFALGWVGWVFALISLGLGVVFKFVSKD